jgi:hypothetical protein
VDAVIATVIAAGLFLLLFGLYGWLLYVKALRRVDQLERATLVLRVPIPKGSAVEHARLTVRDLELMERYSASSLDDYEHIGPTLRLEVSE